MTKLFKLQKRFFLLFGVHQWTLPDTGPYKVLCVALITQIQRLLGGGTDTKKTHTFVSLRQIIVHILRVRSHYLMKHRLDRIYAADMHSDAQRAGCRTPPPPPAAKQTPRSIKLTLAEREAGRRFIMQTCEIVPQDRQPSITRL